MRALLVSVFVVLPSLAMAQMAPPVVVTPSTSSTSATTQGTSSAVQPSPAPSQEKK
jgi:hypothetical protein